MSTREELIQIFEAADLDPNREEIQKFLKENEYIFDDLNELRWKLIMFMGDLGRTVGFDWKARPAEVSWAFDKFLAQYSAELKFTDDEIRMSEEVFPWFDHDALLIVQERLIPFNLEAVEYNTEEDSTSMIVFLKDKLREIKHFELLEYINMYPWGDFDKFDDE